MLRFYLTNRWIHYASHNSRISSFKSAMICGGGLVLSLLNRLPLQLVVDACKLGWKEAILAGSYAESWVWLRLGVRAARGFSKPR